MRKLYITIGICLFILTVLTAPALAFNPQPEPPAIELIPVYLIHPPEPGRIFVPQIAVDATDSLAFR